MNDHALISLGELAPGKQAVVRKLRGGAGFAGRLAAMGLVPGTHIEMLQNAGRGPLLVRAHEARLALGRVEALKILVDETDERSV